MRRLLGSWSGRACVAVPKSAESEQLIHSNKRPSSFANCHCKLFELHRKINLIIYFDDIFFGSRLVIQLGWPLINWYIFMRALVMKLLREGAFSRHPSILRSSRIVFCEFAFLRTPNVKSYVATRYFEILKCWKTTNCLFSFLFNNKWIDSRKKMRR